MQTIVGDWVTSPAQKLNIFVDYFTNPLYQSENLAVENIEEFFSKLNLTSLPLYQFQKLEKPISLNEVLIAIDALKTDKAPGTHGFTPEFYKTFKWTIAPNLHKVLFSNR